MTATIAAHNIRVGMVLACATPGETVRVTEVIDRTDRGYMRVTTVGDDDRVITDDIPTMAPVDLAA